MNQILKGRRQYCVAGYEAYPDPHTHMADILEILAIGQYTAWV